MSQGEPTHPGTKPSRTTVPKIIAEARDKGLWRSTRFGLSMLRARASETTRLPTRKFLFVSHTIDNSGAPLVLLQIVAEFAKRYNPRRIHVVAPEIAPDQLRVLEALGVRIDKTAIPGSQLVSLHLGARLDDFVLINSTAVREHYQRVVFDNLQARRLNHAFLFIHEASDHLRRTGSFLLEDSMVQEISSLVEQRALTILVPSQGTKEAYDELFDTSRVVVVPPRIDVRDEYRQIRIAHDYDQINFVTVGATAVGVKGQLLTIAALKEFLLTTGQDGTNLYRDFTLTLVGIGDDYLSRQLRSIGVSTLGTRLRLVGKVARDEVLALTRQCNVVICSSINETFAMFVAEGMAMGHVVLRTETGGAAEQLNVGENGYAIDTGDIVQFAGVIEELLNRQKTPNERLQAMGRMSQEMIEPYRQLSYLSRIDDLPRPGPHASRAAPAHVADVPRFEDAPSEASDFTPEPHPSGGSG